MFYQKHFIDFNYFFLANKWILQNCHVNVYRQQTAIKTIFQNFIKIQVKHFVINSQDFIDLWQHHKKFVTKKCDYVCLKNEPCYLHKRLNELTDFVDFLRDFNLNDKEMIISKIALIFDQQSSLNQFFRWYNILE